VKEVRDELLSLIPKSWKQELLESIDVELLSAISLEVIMLMWHYIDVNFD